MTNTQTPRRRQSCTAKLCRAWMKFSYWSWHLEATMATSQGFTSRQSSRFVSRNVQKCPEWVCHESVVSVICPRWKMMGWIGSALRVNWQLLRPPTWHLLLSLALFRPHELTLSDTFTFRGIKHLHISSPGCLKLLKDSQGFSRLWFLNSAVRPLCLHGRRKRICGVRRSSTEFDGVRRSSTDLSESLLSQSQFRRDHLVSRMTWILRCLRMTFTAECCIFGSWHILRKILTYI